jgi:hypothetical protein
VTPAGRPLSEILTGSVKPLIGAADTDSDRLEPPLVIVIAAGVLLIVKSGTTAVDIVRAAVAV